MIDGQWSVLINLINIDNLLFFRPGLGLVWMTICI